MIDELRAFMRSALVFCCIFSWVLCLLSCSSSGGDDESSSPAAETITSLARVAFWGYQIQNIDNQGAVDALAASRYDMLVVEPTRTDWSSDARNFDTAGMVSRLKASMGHAGVTPKLVIAYIDIGEAEDWRWYWTWSTGWSAGAAKPADWPEFIVARDPDGWEGNYPVAYWHEGWKDIVIHGVNQSSAPHGDYSSVLDEVLRDGFDGVYLDWVEGFEDESVLAAAARDGVNAAAEMVSFIAEMRSYGRARNPNFLVIQQNGAALAEQQPQVLSLVDALAQEAIWFDGDATDDWGDPDGYDDVNDSSLTQYYTNLLGRYIQAGLPVFDCEYALSSAGNAYQLAASHGYIPYSTRRSLGQLTTTPPPGY